MERLARTVQAVTGDTVDIAYVDQGYTGERAAKSAAAHGVALEVIKLPEAKRGFVLLPRRWAEPAKKVPAMRSIVGRRAEGVERSFAWATRFRRLVKDYECPAEAGSRVRTHWS